MSFERFSLLVSISLMLLTKILWEFLDSHENMSRIFFQENLFSREEISGPKRS
eukprot:UN22035